MIAAAVAGDREVATRLAAVPERLRAELDRTMSRLGIALADRVRAKLSGPVLGARSGALRASIAAEVAPTAEGVVLRVTSGSPYAAIHEFGGVTAAHEIRARKAAALAFMRGGSLAFATSVRHPGSRIPARSFLRTSLAEMEGVVLAAIDEAVTAAARP